jgi:hypothetical protein
MAVRTIFFGINDKIHNCLISKVIYIRKKRREISSYYTTTRIGLDFQRYKEC